MFPTKKLLAATFAGAICLSTFAADAMAGNRYGPGGLGSNLHRRHVIKQAEKRIARGQSVRGRAILWQTSTSSSLYRSVPSWRRW